MTSCRRDGSRPVRNARLAAILGLRRWAGTAGTISPAAQGVAAFTEPSGLSFVPFFTQYDRRSALCLRRMDTTQRRGELKLRADEQARQAKLTKAATAAPRFVRLVDDNGTEQARDKLTVECFSIAHAPYEITAIFSP